jgi:menaquinone-dependent protoporphyrinogen oxidase
MKRILVAYATMAGSSAEVARAVAEELVKQGMQADVVPVGDVVSLAGYDGVVVGAPMIMGWHRDALRFLKQHRKALKTVPLAIFVLAMSLTRSGETSVDGVPVFVDERLPKAPQAEGHLTFKERYARLTNYVRPILQAAHPAVPVSVGLFGGRMEYGRLKWWAVVFAMLIIAAPAGDQRNWTAIRAWAASLPAAMGLAAADAAAERQMA